MSNINYNIPNAPTSLIPGNSNDDTTTVEILKVQTLTDGITTLENNKFSNLLEPILSTDLATKNYVDTTSAPLLESITTITTTGNVSYTAAQVIGGTIVRNLSGAIRTDAFPTATAIIAALGTNVAIVGYTFKTYIQNISSSSDEILTINLTSAGLTPIQSTVIPNTNPTLAITDILVVSLTLTNIGSGTEAIEYFYSNSIYQNEMMTVSSNGIFKLIGGFMLPNKTVYKTNNTSNINGSGITYSFGQVINTVLNRNTTIVGTIDILPSKQTLNAGELNNNDTYTFIVRNIGTETLTIIGNTGTTIDPNSIIDGLSSQIIIRPQESSTISLIYNSSSETFVAYPIINSGF